MTNTLNTPIEVLETHFPLRVTRYAIRRYSGGKGKYQGGNGIVRIYQFLEQAQFTLLTERRSHKPWGIHGGEAGQAGRNLLNGQELASKCHIHAMAGDELVIETPGGGGYGQPE
jgi:N-methylhydantoinase B